MENGIELLKSVIDPELGVNIVDLGLVYKAEINDTSFDILMTLTTPACPYIDMLEAQINMVAESENLEAHITYTFDPPWNPSSITQEILLSKGLL